jgi:hypothetical protein
VCRLTLQEADAIVQRALAKARELLKCRVAVVDAGGAAIVMKRAGSAYSDQISPSPKPGVLSGWRIASLPLGLHSASDRRWWIARMPPGGAFGRPRVCVRALANTD